MNNAGRMDPRRYPKAEEEATKLQFKEVQKQNREEAEADEAAAALDAAKARRAMGRGRRKVHMDGSDNPEEGHTAEL